MNYYNILKLLEKSFVALVCLSVMSCGYFSDKKVEDADTYRSENLSGGCEIDIDELSKILESDVRAQLSCLEENLNKFSQYVKRDDPSNINDVELSSFVRRFFQGHAQVIIESIGMIFDINALMLEGSQQEVSTQNIRPLFELLKIANLRLSLITSAFNDFNNEKISYELAHEVITSELSSFSNEVKNIISRYSSTNSIELNIRDFLDRVRSQFPTFSVSEKTINIALAVKKLYLGGNKDILTRSELFLLLDKVPKLVSAAFSTAFVDTGDDKIALYKQYNSNLTIIKEELFHHRHQEHIIDIEEINGLIESYLGVDDPEFFKGVFESFIANILNNGIKKNSLNFKDIRNIINFSDTILASMQFKEEAESLLGEKLAWNKGTWSSRKLAFIELFDRFRTKIIKNFGENVFLPEKMYIFPLLKDYSRLSKEEDTLKKYLDLGVTLKLLFVGGQKDSFSKLDILNLLEKSGKLSDVGFDLLYSNDETHDSQNLSFLYYKALKILRPLITSDDYLHLITVDELVDVLGDFLEQESIKKYAPTVKDIKQKILGGYPASFSIRDVSKVLEIVSELMGMRYFLDITYDIYEVELANPDPISYLPYKHHENYDFFGKDIVLEYRKEFLDIIKTFRLYRDKDGYQYFGDDIRRTKVGLIELYTYRKLFNIMAKDYGHFDEATQMYATNLDELNAILYTFKPVLEEFGLWSAHPETFGRNTLLLADLFHGTSDGSMSIDGNEVAEYGTLALFAIQTADEFIENLKDGKCEWLTRDEVEGFDVKCYRSHYFDTLMNEMKISQYLPKLANYLNSVSKEEANEYHVAVEGFARDFPGLERPETRRDLILLIGAMFNIESTFLRYDKDRSNLLERGELDIGFPVYEDAIVSLAGLDEGKKSFAHSIFLYMIKNMEIPSKVQLLNFHYNPFIRKDISAKRLSIGSLLYNMVMAADSDEEQDD